eukprot:4211466-Alexandrium_andersonii.AAC.1
MKSVLGRVGGALLFVALLVLVVGGGGGGGRVVASLWGCARLRAGGRERPRLDCRTGGGAPMGAASLGCRARGGADSSSGW